MQEKQIFLPLVRVNPVYTQSAADKYPIGYVHLGKSLSYAYDRMKAISKYETLGFMLI